MKHKKNGGNCELTQPGTTTVHKGVTIIGKTDFPSLMAKQSSTFYSNNLFKLIEHMKGAEKNTFGINMSDPVVRGASVLSGGVLKWPPPPPKVAPPPPKKPEAAPVKQATKEVSLYEPTRNKAYLTGGALSALMLCGVAGESLAPAISTFALACYLGNQVVWGVTPALHTPLMSVTNAISVSLVDLIWKQS